MDNVSLIRSFVESAIAGQSVLLANVELRIEPIGDSLQLWSKQEGMVASARSIHDNPLIAVKDTARHWSDLHNTLLLNGYLPTQPGLASGFYQYEVADIPKGYDVHYTDSLVFLQAWWRYQQQEDPGLMGMLLWSHRTWQPIRTVDCEDGCLTVSGWGSEVMLHPAQRIIWLLKATVVTSEMAEATTDASLLDTEQTSTTLLPLVNPAKCIGNYLVEAGLLSTAQVDVILLDQASTGLRFGEIVVSRGWLKEQTIEYLMKHLIAPQQSAPTLLQVAVEELPDHHPSRPPIDRDRSPASVHERETLVVSGINSDEVD
jgi:hypothetical protein